MVLFCNISYLNLHTREIPSTLDFQGSPQALKHITTLYTQLKFSTNSEILSRPKTQLCILTHLFIIKWHYRSWKTELDYKMQCPEDWPNLRLSWHPTVNIQVIKMHQQSKYLSISKQAILHSHVHGMCVCMHLQLSETKIVPRTRQSWNDDVILAKYQLIFSGTNKTFLKTSEHF